MAKVESEKMLGAELPEDLISTFMGQAEAMDCKKKVALKAAVKLWVELPSDIRLKLLDQSLDGATFVELVHQIVDQRLADGDRGGEKLASRPPRKRGRKG